MKKNIHPKYFEKSKITCSCGATFDFGSTKEEVKVEICSNCHPAYTGNKRFVDTAGRLDKFKQRMEKSKKLQSEKKQQEEKAKNKKQDKQKEADEKEDKEKSK